MVREILVPNDMAGDRWLRDHGLAGDPRVVRYEPTVVRVSLWERLHRWWCGWSRTG